MSLSTTIALDTRAKELVAAGRDVVNMTVGEPDFNAPEAVQSAAVSAVRSGKVRYTRGGHAFAAQDHRRARHRNPRGCVRRQ
jgi:aspartate aminotransferase